MPNVSGIRPRVTRETSHLGRSECFKAENVARTLEHDDMQRFVTLRDGRLRRMTNAVPFLIERL
jgi:hypothetical protein